MYLIDGIKIGDKIVKKRLVARSSENTWAVVSGKLTYYRHTKAQRKQSYILADLKSKTFFQCLNVSELAALDWLDATAEELQLVEDMFAVHNNDHQVAFALLPYIDANAFLTPPGTRTRKSSAKSKPPESSEQLQPTRKKPRTTKKEKHTETPPSSPIPDPHGLTTDDLPMIVKAVAQEVKGMLQISMNAMPMHMPVQPSGVVVAEAHPHPVTAAALSGVPAGPLQSPLYTFNFYVPTRGY